MRNFRPNPKQRNAPIFYTPRRAGPLTDLLVAAGEQEDIRAFFGPGPSEAGTLSNREDGAVSGRGLDVQRFSCNLAV